MRDRKNQKDLKVPEWAAFINAINQTHGVGAKAPAYRDFVAVHARAMNMSDPVGMSWGVHSMGQMMPGRNFLAWHRRFVLQMESRLRKVDATITIPYWNAIETSVPFTVAPVWIWTVTGVVSLAVPVKDGVVLLDGDSGEFKATLGAVMSTVNVTGKLVPISDVKLVCDACAV